MERNIAAQTHGLALQPSNTLFYGDNLPILREHIADESVDLEYLDPPFGTFNQATRVEAGKAGKQGELDLEG